MGRLTAVVVLAAALLGCGDQTDTIVIDDQRYSGAEIPLELDGMTLIPAGLVEEAANAGRVGLPLFTLPGIPVETVVLAQREGVQAEIEPFIVYRSLALGDGNLFTLVPAMCAYAPTRDECVPVAQ